ncbi:MAG TPA: response regulator, partial [Cryptosporangiaceae bacterium]|nr:response regulator [Cryptosporangiaceae bacterium]
MSAAASMERPASGSGPGSDGIRVLLVEDDPGDALLVREYLADVPLPTVLIEARTLAEASVALTEDVDCVLLDLALPDADGLDGLHEVLGIAPKVAVIVLTGLADEYRGVAAVAAGAQDYLVKDQVDGPLLARAIRFAIERRRADDAARQLREADLLAQENARLERGLLPSPLVHAPDLVLRCAYRPGRRQALLGGDFYDVVQAPDGSVYAVVGDVSGHGPDEAALGVCLRIAWRTLVLCGADQENILPVLNRVLVSERRTAYAFATVCMVKIGPHRRAVQC